MTLAPGDRLGPYEITAKLGEGGMGLVFQAKDFQLGRNVALKVLPEGFTNDPERLARFEREAKLLAQLNHPNIAQIYGLETSGDTRALVMELVDGPTLAERLEAGPFPFNESLSVSLQIALALEEAHEKGIVHRDLKPQNIKASIEGKVKVLDFGLAKALDPTSAGGASASALAKSPTLTLGATVQGMILGTAAYMAPEQARGLPVDKRADIWAFGVVLYEMLSGRRLFEGELVSDVLAGVLRQEVDWSALPADLPVSIRSLLRRCLERNPKNRLHDIADARIVIEEALSGRSEEAVATVAPGPLAVPASAARPLWFALGALGALAVGLALGAFWPRGERGDAAVQYFPLAFPAGWRLADIDTPQIAISPDGTRRAVAALDPEGTQRLLLSESGAIDWRALDGTLGARSPFFSPDGRWIGFFNGRNLMRIAVDGGPPLEITSTGNQVRGAVWLPDHTILFSPDAATPFLRIAEGGGEAKPFTTLDTARKERTHRWPDFLPDGSAALFTSDTIETTEFYDDANIDAVVVATGERKTVLKGSSMARYLEPGTLLFARGGSLFAVRFDPRKLETSGSPVPVKQLVATNVASGAAQFATSRSGALFWVPGGASTAGNAPVWVDRKGARTPAGLEAGNFLQIALSPDGKRLAATDGSGASVDLWILDLDRRTKSRLTFEGDVADPTWSADGERVAYTRSVGAAGNGDLFWRRVDGRGQEEALVSSPETKFLGSFSPDGRFLAFERIEVGSSHNDIWILPLDGERVARPFIQTPATEFNPTFSPDGRWLAYGSLESGRSELFVQPFPSGDGRWQISTSGGTEPQWSHDGKELYFRSSGSLYAVTIDTSSGFSFGSPERIAGGLRRGDNSRSYSPSPDGQRFVALTAWELERDSGQINLALGWAREVRRLLEGAR